jgi:putative ABC transport system permease protein
MRPPNDPSLLVDVNAMQRVVSPTYFKALALHLVSGRTIAETDAMTSRNVIVVNRSFAAKYLGAQPIGSVVPNLGMCRGDNDQWEVVGIVDDMRQGGILSDAPQPEIFMPYRQVGCATAVTEPIIVVRTKDDPVPFAATLRQIVRDQSPTLALDSVMTMDDRVLTNLAKPRLYAVVLAGFAAFALTISGVGLFGVLSYIVAQRSREIGVRTALGARPGDIIGLVVRQVAAISALGILIGLWIAFAASQWLTTVLYGVAPHDPVSFVVVPAVLIVVTAIAAVVPARRAARVDPLTVLR